MHRHFLLKLQSTLVMAGALTACLLSSYHLPIERFDLSFLLLALFTVCFASRLGVPIPHVGGEITVSETFIFITLLMYGAEAAILLTAVEALCSAARFSRKWHTVALNTAVLTLSTSATALVLRFVLHTPTTRLPNSTDISVYITALCLMALTQYVVNSGLIASHIALKTAEPFFQTWKKHYLWTSITYFVGATGAGVIVKTVDVIGFYTMLAVSPIVAAIYWTYRVYLKNVEVSATQAAQAEEHARVLQEQAGALQASEERFRSAFDHAPIGMALVSPTGRWLQVNRALCEILGYTEEAMLATNLRRISHPHDLGAALDNIDRLLGGVAPTCAREQRFRHQDGRDVWVALSASLADTPLADAAQEDKSATPAQRLIFQIQDVTDRKRAEEQLRHDAFHDSLTSLPNRPCFMEHLRLTINRTAHAEDGGRRRFAVLFLDLDRFKIINDSLGHLAGDEMLKDTAQRLKSCVRPGDLVARLGGDEFTILLDNLVDEADAVQIAERINKQLAMTYVLNGNEVFTSASIGITMSTHGYAKADDMLRDADAAMYRAKALGKSRYALFDRQMHQQATSLLHIEIDLRRAVERSEFVLHYQPITCLRTGTIRGFEALLRWQHPERGMISPADFIPVAEETGLIVPIGEWALREACRRTREWHRQTGNDQLTISVNISAKQFAQPDLVSKIRGILDETGLDPRSLNLEITESVVMQNVESATNMLAQIRRLGVALSLDDFGTGYSSLSYLHRFPISTLKIDRSFVSRIAENNENAEIVRTIIMLARNLGMKTVAEGVESMLQLTSLAKLDCDSAQGYLFSRPVDAEALTNLLMTRDSFDLSAPDRERTTGVTLAPPDLPCDIDFSHSEAVS